MLIAMSRYELEPEEQQSDHQPPGPVTVSRVEVTRGRAMPAGTWIEDADIGSVSLQVVPPGDNRTPPERMGFSIRHAAGKLPGPGMIPTYYVRAIRHPTGYWYLVLYWTDGATDTHPPIQFLLSVAAVDLGGNVGPYTEVTVCDPPIDRPAVDELPYDPRKLHIVDEGRDGWLLTDDASRMLMFDNEEDARNGLAVAQRHTRHGFVGRGNHRPNRGDYIFTYWTGSSGLPPAGLSKTDALPYDKTSLVANDLGAKGWRLEAGRMAMVLADNRADAVVELEIASRHHRMCFIGRDNKRPNRKAYIMTYWE